MQFKVTSNKVHFCETAHHNLIINLPLHPRSPESHFGNKVRECQRVEPWGLILLTLGSWLVLLLDVPPPSHFHIFYGSDDQTIPASAALIIDLLLSIFLFVSIFKYAFCSSNLTFLFSRTLIYNFTYGEQLQTMTLLPVVMPIAPQLSLSQFSLPVHLLCSSQITEWDMCMRYTHTTPRSNITTFSYLNHLHQLI